MLHSSCTSTHADTCNPNEPRQGIIDLFRCCQFYNVPFHPNPVGDSLGCRGCRHHRHRNQTPQNAHRLNPLSPHQSWPASSVRCLGWQPSAHSEAQRIGTPVPPVVLFLSVVQHLYVKIVLFTESYQIIVMHY